MLRYQNKNSWCYVLLDCIRKTAESSLSGVFVYTRGASKVKEIAILLYIVRLMTNLLMFPNDAS